MINATELVFTDVDWPGYPPLFELPPALDLDRSYQVMQVHFYSPILQAWVKLVPVKDGETGVIEVTPGDMQAIRALEAQGVPKVEAIRQVLGVVPGGAG